MSGLVTVFLAFLAAVFYLAAAVILKQWSQLPLWLAASGALVTLGLACAVEYEVLRRARFADVIVLIIAAEVAMAALLSQMAFGDGLRLRDGLGLVVIVVGVVILLGGHDARQDTQAQAMARIFRA